MNNRNALALACFPAFLLILGGLLVQGGCILDPAARAEWMVRAKALEVLSTEVEQAYKGLHAAIKFLDQLRDDYKAGKVTENYPEKLKKARDLVTLNRVNYESLTEKLKAEKLNLEKFQKDHQVPTYQMVIAGIISLLFSSGVGGKLVASFGHKIGRGAEVYGTLRDFYGIIETAAAKATAEKPANQIPSPEEVIKHIKKEVNGLECEYVKEIHTAAKRDEGRSTTA